MTVNRIVIAAVCAGLTLFCTSGFAQEENTSQERMTEQEAVDYLGLCSGVFFWFSEVPDQNGSKKSFEMAANNAAACGAYWKKKRARLDPRMEERELSKSVWEYVDEQVDEALSIEQQLGNLYINYYVAKEKDDAVTAILRDCRTLPELMVLLEECREVEDLFIGEEQ